MRNETNNKIKKVQLKKLNVKEVELKSTIENVIYDKMGVFPSEEQLEILLNIIQGKDTIVNAVAGSGKTTLVIMLAHAVREIYGYQTIIHLTYNRELSMDNNKKIEEKNASDMIKSYTFHSFATVLSHAGSNHELYSKVFNNTKFPAIHNDSLLEVFNKHSYEIPQEYQPVFFVIDEAQDLDKLKASFLKQFYNLLPVKPIILVLGDHFQSIYQYQGANPIYLTNFDKVFNIEMETKTLRTSYRVPYDLARTLNRFFIREDYFKVDNKPAFTEDGTLYIADNNYNSRDKDTYLNDTHNWQYLVDFIKDRKKNDVRWDDFFVLFFNIKGIDKVSALENYFIENGIPVYNPTSNNKNSKNAKESKNKVAFSTIHQAKGREKKYVIIPFFDLSFYKNYLKTPQSQKNISYHIPNEHYVALTRAQKEVVIGCNFSNSKFANNNAVPSEYRGKLKWFPYIDWKDIALNASSTSPNKYKIQFLLYSIDGVVSALYAAKHMEGKTKEITKMDLLRGVYFYYTGDVSVLDLNLSGHSLGSHIPQYIEKNLEDRLEKFVTKETKRWKPLHIKKQVIVNHDNPDEERFYNDSLLNLTATYITFEAIKKIYPHLFPNFLKASIEKINKITFQHLSYELLKFKTYKYYLKSQDKENEGMYSLLYKSLSTLYSKIGWYFDNQYINTHENHIDYNRFWDSLTLQEKVSFITVFVVCEQWKMDYLYLPLENLITETDAITQEEINKRIRILIGINNYTSFNQRFNINYTPENEELNTMTLTSTILGHKYHIVAKEDKILANGTIELLTYDSMSIEKKFINLTTESTASFETKINAALQLYISNIWSSMDSYVSEETWEEFCNNYSKKVNKETRSIAYEKVLEKVTTHINNEIYSTKSQSTIDEVLKHPEVYFTENLQKYYEKIKNIVNAYFEPKECVEIINYLNGNKWIMKNDKKEIKSLIDELIYHKQSISQTSSLDDELNELNTLMATYPQR